MPDLKGKQQSISPAEIPSDDESNEASPSEGELSFAALIGSVFAAALGVQSQKNRERDFKSGKFKTFIIAGVIFTLAFMFTLFAIVQMVLSKA